MNFGQIGIADMKAGTRMNMNENIYKCIAYTRNPVCVVHNILNNY